MKRLGSSCSRFRLGSALALLALVAVVAGCGTKSRARSPRVPVTLARAEVRSVPLRLTATGTVEASQDADVGSQVGGVVTRVRFAEGQFVRQGQVLFELDPRPFRNALDAAQASLSRARSQAENAKREADRARTLHEQNVLSQAEWDQKRAASEAAASAVRAEQAAANLARLNLGYATIRAPISGQTGRRMVNVGDLVKAATSEPLVKVVQIEPVRVRFTVPVNEVPLIQRFRAANPVVRVTTPGDSAVRTGTLVFVDNAVDEASGTLLLKGEFPNHDRALVPGQFVEVHLVLEEQRDKVVVPSAAVSRGQEGAFVYVLAADSTVATRAVTVERTLDDVTVLAEGLTSGEQVVVDGQLRLSPGSKVIVREPGAGRDGGRAQGAPAGAPGSGGDGARRGAANAGGVGRRTP